MNNTREPRDVRKVTLKLHVSLDGYVCSHRGDAMDWVFRTYDDELKNWEVAQLQQASVHAMGRALYEDMADHWPHSTEVFAEPMNQTPKVVFSNTLAEAPWAHSSIARGDAPAAMRHLRSQPGGPILVHGGVSLAQSLLHAGLVDELLLILHPVALTKGLPLFTQPMDLHLVSSRPFPGGAVLLVYRRA